LLRHAEREHTHGDLVGAAVGVAEAFEIEPGDRVVLRADPTEPAVFAAATLAPLVADAVVVIPDEATVGDVAVGEGSEERTVDPATVL
jgi:hypothetical protein